MADKAVFSRWDNKPVYKPGKKAELGNFMEFLSSKIMIYINRSYYTKRQDSFARAVINMVSYETQRPLVPFTPGSSGNKKISHLKNVLFPPCAE